MSTRGKREKASLSRTLEGFMSNQLHHNIFSKKRLRERLQQLFRDSFVSSKKSTTCHVRLVSISVFGTVRGSVMWFARCRRPIAAHRADNAFRISILSLSSLLNALNGSRCHRPLSSHSPHNINPVVAVRAVMSRIRKINPISAAQHRPQLRKVLDNGTRQ